MTVRSTPLIARDEMAARGAALGVVIVALGLLLAGLVPGTPQAAQARTEATATPALVIYATGVPPAAQDGAPPIQPDPAANQLVPQAAPTDPQPAPVVAQGAPTAAPVRYEPAPIVQEPAGSAAPVAAYHPPAGIEDWYTPPQAAPIDAQALYDRAALAAVYRNLPVAGEPPSQAALDAAAQQVYGATRHSTGR